MSRRLLFVLGSLIAVGLTVLLLRSDLGTNIVWDLSGQGRLLAPLVIVSALLDSINPCAFAILLVTIAVLFGMGAMRGKFLVIGSAYISGIFLAYLAIGLGILGALHLFSVPHFMGKVGAGLLILWGVINVVNVYVPSFPIKMGIPHAVHRKMAVLMGRASLPAAFALGLLVGLCEFPCTGGPYLVVLGLLHDSATYLKGFGYLLLYNAIFVLPLILVLLLVGDRAVLERFESWKQSNARSMRLWTGVAMLIFGVLILLL